MTACGGLVRTVRPAATTIDSDGRFAWTGTHVTALDDGDEDRHRLSLAGRRESGGTLAGTWRGERDAYNGQGRSIDWTCSSGDVAFAVRAGAIAMQPAPRRDGTGAIVTALEDEPMLAACGSWRATASCAPIRATGASYAPSASPRTNASRPHVGATASPPRSSWRRAVTSSGS